MTHSRLLRRLLRQRATLFWAAVVLVVLAGAAFAPLLAPFGPDDGNIREGLASPSAEHLLGTDKLGRDVFSRLMFGAQIALLAAFEAVGIAVLVGVPLGLLSGYLGGWLDRIAMRIVEGVMSVPFLVLAIALISILGPGLAKSMAVVGVVYATIMLRLTRGLTLAAREELYVDGVRVTGGSDRRILFQHVLPNILPALIVQVTLMLAGAIVAEATLSFLGLGVQAPAASWGTMLSDAQASIRESFFLALPPGVAILITVLAFNQVGDGLRDLFAREAKGGSLGVNPVQPVVGSPVAALPGASVPDPLLRVSDLTVSFPGADGSPMEVVQGVSLDVGRGEIVGLVGESGSGKSVTAMALLGLVPDPGRVAAATVALDGQELTGRTFDELRAVRGGRIGVVFQEPIASLNPAYTVGDQVAEVLREHTDMGREEVARRVVELFEQVHVPDPQLRMRDYPHQFSGGMAQRVMIAMALACRPQLLIADEPTTALDVTVQGQVLDLLLELRGSTGMSILLITHDLGVVADVADRVAVMYAGQLVEAGPTAEVFARPAHPYTEGLLGSLPRNVRRVGRLPSIPGVVPPPAQWPQSCHFAQRCRYAQDRCRAAPVELLASQPGPARAARCVRSGELELTGVAEAPDRALVPTEEGR
ncbi:dipeptide/oligopeptide/nickel ABC transporter permease/ATP-binding protein [Pseudonocardia kunmingensis]|uniref:Peptide/nickel transport system permease protein n=1 Tax=Pseudonocardia kunmingensis TaxID=630975 RepID=A0A543DPU5_9PSEU|nr:dipeptide/oligopeptide/nickel ABC transporter permease/ATP-binding protein [Pseudonocardia kunmingensis]TQM11328.1 peptide/nickel transport system permease protein [Pseudonocardia kunmingensis]